MTLLEDLPAEASADWSVTWSNPRAAELYDAAIAALKEQTDRANNAEFLIGRARLEAGRTFTDAAESFHDRLDSVVAVLNGGEPTPEPPVQHRAGLCQWGDLTVLFQWQLIPGMSESYYCTICGRETGK